MTVGLVRTESPFSVVWSLSLTSGLVRTESPFTLLSLCVSAGLVRTVTIHTGFVRTESPFTLLSLCVSAGLVRTVTIHTGLVRTESPFTLLSLSVSAGLVTTESPFSLACAKMKEQQNRDEASEQKEVGSPVQSSSQVHACHHGRSSTAAVTGVTGKHSVCKAVAKRKDSVPLVLYRRPLPESCIAFASEEGKKIFVEALISGTFLFCFYI